MQTLTALKRKARQQYADMKPGPSPFQSEPTGKRKDEIGYERSVPRCETCRHCRPEKTLLNRQTARLPVVVIPPLCRLGNFQTRPMAICDHWTGTNGDVLAVG